MRDISPEYAALCGCTYCDLRHFSCGHDIPTGSCEFFVLGKCFNCTIRKASNGEFVEGVCSDAYDYGGCVNYKPIEDEDE